MKYIIFDVDGVLIDSENVITDAASRALAERGIKAGMPEFKQYIGTGEKNFIIGLANEHGKSKYTDDMIERMFELYEQAAATDLKVFPAVPDTIDRLFSSGFTLAVASSATRRKLTVSLRIAGIDEKKFAVILSGDDVSAKKPSPEIYLKTAEALGAAPSECVVIEDALSGVRAAKAAGMKCAAVTTSFSEEELKGVGADFVADNIGDAAEKIIADLK